jgi:hypothetical protein
MASSYILTLGESHLAHKTEEKGKQGELVVHKPSPAFLYLEDVCPVWSMKIRHRFEQTGKSMMSTHSKHCLVGESWLTGRHAGYYIAPLIPSLGCWTCVMYGHTMGNLSRKRESSRIFRTPNCRFLNHWNEKHKSITENLKKGTKRHVIL